jgi:3-dehydroquinate dehydratase-2
MADESKKAIVVLLHGCNLDMLGKRDPRHYGNVTLAELERSVIEHGRELGMEVVPFQTNHEGALVEKIHEYWQDAAGMIINPGAWTHYSYALHDALEMVQGPIIEVHLSDIAGREQWRRLSVISDVCALTISGKGPEGYIEALDWLAANPAGA